MTTVLLGSGVSFAHTQLDSLARIASVLRVLFCLGRIPCGARACLCALLYLVASPGHMLSCCRALTPCATGWAYMILEGTCLSVCLSVCALGWLRLRLRLRPLSRLSQFLTTALSGLLGVDWVSERVRGAVMGRCTHRQTDTCDDARLLKRDFGDMYTQRERIPCC